jgi:CubicO group peptidase (beta-lactamase class C family)
MPNHTRAALAAAALLVAAPAHAQDKTAEIDKIFAWVAPTAPGCVVAVSQNGKLVVNRAYGLADLERAIPLTTESVFDAGSLRKQFVAASILLLVEEGRLSLSDDVRKHLPQLPDYGHTITIEHLLTHTSGLRDWTGLLNLASGDPDAMSMILRQRGLNFTPGEEWSYTNTGYVLATEIVARTSGMSFAAFASKRLFEPLGMKRTTYVDDMKADVKNRALAYEKAGGGWKPDMLLGNDRGGGGALFTTASDLIIWNEALANKRLGAFVSAKLEEPTTLNNGRKVTTAGRGLFMETYRGSREVWYTGSAAAYKGFLGRFPDHRLSIAILCNSGESANRTLYAQQIFDLFVPSAMASAPESGPPPAMTGDTLAEAASKAGLFVNERTGEMLRLAVDRGRFRVAGGPGLVAITKDRFRRFGAFAQFMSQDEFELHFLSPDVFELRSMEGAVTRYRRAHPFSPTAEELKAFAGRYESDELMAVFHATPGKDALMLRTGDMPGEGIEFRPVDRDTFQRGMITVRFRRDNAGKIVALEFTNPVLRNIRFTRRADQKPAGV